jgi:phospholipid/cholesterol/gamma-HCH transport system permease protein
MAETAPQDASIRMDGNTLVCSHCWTVSGIGPLSAALNELPVPEGDSVLIDGAAIAAMDTAGAWLLLQVRRHMEAANRQVNFSGFLPDHARLIKYITGESQDAERVIAPHPKRSVMDRWQAVCIDLVDFLAFIGQAVVSLFRAIRHPGRIRWPEIFSEIYKTGVKALPIVGLLSFLMGVVFAYLGAVQLSQYGADLYLADMVGYAMLRELAPLLTAILICGRTGSAFAAQIGTMQVREEVAALETIGVSPVDLLVLPKLLALILVLPLLSVFADVLAVIGGMVQANLQLGLGFYAFLFRLQEAISFSTFMIGIGKAPVFAAIIAIVGCYQGFKVQGSAESVGRHTTISVVQSIFLVIVTDAMFSVLFSLLGV